MKIEQNNTENEKNKKNTSLHEQNIYNNTTSKYTNKISTMVILVSIIILFAVIYFLIKSWNLRKSCDLVRPNGWTKNVSALFLVLIVLVILPTQLSNAALVVLIVLYFQYRDDCVDNKISNIKNMLSKHF